MLRGAQQIRLTRKERDKFLRITDIEPKGIRTLEDLDAYIRRCKARFWGMSEQTQFVHWLIDEEYRRCRGLA